MAWIAAAIGAVGGIVQTGMRNDAAKGQAMNLPPSLANMLTVDSSMNNAGMIVTTHGSTANATSSSERTSSPSLSSGQPMNLLGQNGQLANMDLTTLLMIGGAVMLIARKK